MASQVFQDSGAPNIALRAIARNKVSTENSGRGLRQWMSRVKPFSMAESDDDVSIASPIDPDEYDRSELTSDGDTPSKGPAYEAAQARAQGAQLLAIAHSMMYTFDVAKDCHWWTPPSHLSAFFVLEAHSSTVFPGELHQVT